MSSCWLFSDFYRIVISRNTFLTAAEVISALSSEEIGTCTNVHFSEADATNIVGGKKQFSPRTLNSIKQRELNEHKSRIGMLLLSDLRICAEPLAESSQYVVERVSQATIIQWHKYYEAKKYMDIIAEAFLLAIDNEISIYATEKCCSMPWHIEPSTEISPQEAFYDTQKGGSNMEKAIAAPGYDKIFISHSSEDVEATKLLYDLISLIGVPDDKIFCSSIPECGVPLDEDIYETIRKQLLSEKVYVLFMLSKNYYNSIACLNEMGAAWILQTSYTSILLPGFDFSDVKGGIKAGRISIKLDGEKTEVFSRLTELKDKIRDGFGLDPLDERKWNRKAYEFIKKITSS